MTPGEFGCEECAELPASCWAFEMALCDYCADKLAELDADAEATA